jgi:hypothetical protein
MKHFPIATRYMVILGRTYADAVNELQAQYKITPLSAWGKPYTPVAPPVNTYPLHGLPAARSIMRAEPERGIESFENMMRLIISPLDLARASRSFGLAHDFCSQSMERKSLSALYYCSDFGTFNIDCRPPCGLRFVISFF